MAKWVYMEIKDFSFVTAKRIAHWKILGEIDFGGCPGSRRFCGVLRLWEGGHRVAVTAGMYLNEELTKREKAGGQTLWEMYESEDRFDQGLRSFEYPLFHASDEEMEFFLGKLVRRVGRAAGGIAKGVGKGLSTVGKIVPLSTLTSALAFTPIGMAIRAGVGAASAAASGKNVFQGAARSIASTPFTRFAVDTASGLAQGQKLGKALQGAGKAQMGDARESLRFAAMVAPFVPGIGTGIGAALGVANALASGERITDALVAGARNAIPGGEIAQTAFDTAANLARGRNLSEAFLEAARSRLPGPIVKAAFDTGLALMKGKKLQDAVLDAGGKLLPKSQFTADTMSFVRKAAAGENLGKAALSSVGNMVMRRIERQTGPILNRAAGRAFGAVREGEYELSLGGQNASGVWKRRGGVVSVMGAF